MNIGPVFARNLELTLERIEMQAVMAIVFSETVFFARIPLVDMTTKI